MVAIMWLTGGKKPPTPAKAASSAAPVQAPLEVNETKIAEMQNRIQDLQRQQLLAQTALAQQTRQLGAPGHDSRSLNNLVLLERASSARKKTPIRAERKRRALRFTVFIQCRSELPESSGECARPGNRDAPCRPGTAPFRPRHLTDRPTLERYAAQFDFSRASRNDSAEATKDRKEEARNPAAVSATSANAAAGKTYVLFEGTILEPSSSTASTGASPAPSSACSQPMSIPTTASTCSSPQAQSCWVKPRR